MLSIPGSLHKQFAENLAEKGVPPGQHGAYLKWLRYYLDFCSKYRFSEKAQESLAAFVQKLQEKRQSPGQLEQVRKAIGLFFQLEMWNSSQIAMEVAHPPGLYAAKQKGSP